MFPQPQTFLVLGTVSRPLGKSATVLYSVEITADLASNFFQP